MAGFTEDGGSRMRCLTIRGYPFGAKTPETLKVVGELTTALYANYGHAGPRFAQWILQHREDWPKWQKRYARHQKTLISLVKDDAGYRLADYGAVVALAADLVHEAIRLPWDKPMAIEDSLWTAMVEEASGAAGHIRALRDLMSWAYAHAETFDGRAPHDREGYVRPPTLGWSGRWDKGKWTEIGFYPHVVKTILSTAGYDPEAILALWKEEGWIVSGDAKHIGKRTRTLGERPWLITFDRTIIEVIDDGGDSGDKVGT